jgi:hypothetical protein
VTLAAWPPFPPPRTFACAARRSGGDLVSPPGLAGRVVGASMTRRAGGQAYRWRVTPEAPTLEISLGDVFDTLPR